jgi:hypothetical protein
MSLRSEYEVWHERSFPADPAHEDASSPWYVVVCEQLGEKTVHQLTIERSRNPTGLAFLEIKRGIRRVLSPLAIDYFLVWQKCGQA